MKKVLIIGATYMGKSSHVLVAQSVQMGDRDTPFVVDYTPKEVVQEKSPFSNEKVYLIENNRQPEPLVPMYTPKFINKPTSKKHQAREKNRSKFWK